MPEEAAEPLAYLAGHLNESLACDPRVSELGLRIDVRGTKLYVTGTVSTSERRAAIDEVVAELAAGYEIHNETVVAAMGTPNDMEHLR